MQNINVLKQQKNERKVAAETLLNAAIAAGRGLNTAEQEQYDGHVAAIRGLETTIAQHAEIASFGTERNDAVVSPRGAVVDANPRATAEYNADFQAYVRTGEIRAALNIGTPAQGGFVVPQEFETELVKKLVAVNVMRQISRTLTTTSDRNIPVQAGKAVAYLTAEGVAPTQSTPTFGRLTMSAYKIACLILASEELMEDSFINVSSEILSQWTDATGLLEENLFVAGTGSGQPTGVLVDAADSGIVTAAPAAITFDELLKLQYALPRQYRTNASFLLKTSTALLTRQLKDGNGQYLWQPNTQTGQPALLLGKPVYESDAMPAAAATNKSVLFGDFGYYRIADRGARTFTRLNERYADTGQIGFRGTERVDGKLTLPEAVVFLSQHA